MIGFCNLLKFEKKIIELYPHFEEYLLEYWPKKDCPARLVKCHEKIELLVVNNEPLFFKQRDGPWLPNLHVLTRDEHFENYFFVIYELIITWSSRKFPDGILIEHVDLQLRVPAIIDVQGCWGPV